MNELWLRNEQYKHRWVCYGYVLLVSLWKVLPKNYRLLSGSVVSKALRFLKVLMNTGLVKESFTLAALYFIEKRQLPSCFQP